MAHIVLDVRVLETSTGRYMQRLLENINDRYSDDGNTYTALVPSAHVEKWQKRLQNINVTGSDHKWYTLAEQWGFYRQLKSLNADLVHFTMPQQPFLYRGASVTTIHDMTLIRFNTMGSDDNPLVYRFKKLVFTTLMRYVMKRSQAIIVPTNFVKNDLKEVYGDTYGDKTYVTYEAGEIPDQPPEALQDFVGKDYICTVGNMFGYKNVRRVVLAFKQLQKNHPELHLLLAGKKDEYAAELEAFVAKENISNVHFLGFISDGEKRWLLENTLAYVTASLSEGFCIPVLEAMYVGAPVVASNASCLPETGGDAALYFDPHSTGSLVEALEPVLNDSSLRESMANDGYKHVKQFSWEKMVDETHAIYMNVLDKNNTVHG